MTHLDDAVLIDLSLGTDTHPHLAGCSDCTTALAATLDALHLLALDLDPVDPPAALRARLLAAVAGPITRHSARVAALFALPPADVAAVLARVHTGAAAWTTVLPGIDACALSPSGARECGLIRAAAGATFPHHRHLGDETVFVLQGSCSDSDGRAFGPGDTVHHTRGTAHHLEIHPGQPLVFAYVTDGTDFTATPT